MGICIKHYSFSVNCVFFLIKKSLACFSNYLFQDHHAWKTIWFGIGSDSLSVPGKALLCLWASCQVVEWLCPLECPISLKLSFFLIKAGDRGECQEKLLYFPHPQTGDMLQRMTKW